MTDETRENVPDDLTTSVDEPDSAAVELDDTAAEASPPAAATSPRAGGLRGILIPAVLATLLLASAAFAAWVYFEQYRPDDQTSSTVAASAMDAASEGTVALLSYSPESLDQDFATAKTHLTGEFLTYYTQFTTDIVTPAAKQKDVKTSADVVRSAVSEIQPDSAVVLVFINQTTTSKENPAGSFTASSVKVGMTKVDGKWLINAFDPV
ncbi:MAG: twin-arginine translocation pathway signal [Mycobacterium sp.]|nr:twin-arginine translocation pathway signal [Mycobacterium sp.]